TESIHTALFSLLALLLIFGWPLRSFAGALGFGLITCAALFIRPITICVFPALLWKFIQEHRSWRGIICLLLTGLPSLAGMSAWTVRNYRLFEEFVPFTTNIGHHNAWDYDLHADRAFLHLRQQRLNEAQINKALIRAEREFYIDNPGKCLVRYLWRAMALFSLKPAWETEQVLWELVLPIRPSGTYIPHLYHTMFWQYYVTYILAACGAGILVLRRRELAGLWTLMICYVLIHAMVSRGDMRLAAPLYPLMCLLATTLFSAGSRQAQGHKESHGNNTVMNQA
ncbi:MAG: hypothetical protein KJ749_09820, partial [Planctomycetes bacterium]|nr:hypothetical protein [Planctomycetota bacterium]